MHRDTTNLAVNMCYTQSHLLACNTLENVTTEGRIYLFPISCQFENEIFIHCNE